MKWLGMLRVFTHPSLLPLAISTFVSIAGPGGVAEIGLHAPTVANLETTQNAPVVVAPPYQPLVLVLRAVPQQAPADVPDQPLASPVDPQLGGQDAPATGTSPVPPEAFDTTQAPELEPVASSDHIEDSVSEIPVTPPSDIGDEPAPPADDTDDDTGEPDADGNENDEGSGDDVPVCDPPGTGPDPHGGVPPGHDENADGVDDRCQDGTGDDDTGSGDGGTGTGDESTGSAGDGTDTSVDGTGTGDDDTGTGDDGTDTGDDGTGTGDDGADTGDDGDEPVCDPPGTGPAPHGGVPPGHDKNEDGIDDRCQEGGEEGNLDGCHSNGNANGNGHDQDGDGVDDHCADSTEATAPTGNDGKGDKKDKNKKEDDS